jgi:hypothetical protein
MSGFAPSWNQNRETMQKNYKLMRDDTLLGVLTRYEYDFPWVYCHFIAEPVFATLQPLFDAEQQVAESMEAWDKAYEPIVALNLYLLSDDGTKIEEMLLHIANGEAWFRF